MPRPPKTPQIVQEELRSFRLDQILIATLAQLQASLKGNVNWVNVWGKITELDRLCANEMALERVLIRQVSSTTTGKKKKTVIKLQTQELTLLNYLEKVLDNLLSTHKDTRKLRVQLQEEQGPAGKNRVTVVRKLTSALGQRAKAMSTEVSEAQKVLNKAENLKRMEAQMVWM